MNRIQVGRYALLIFFAVLIWGFALFDAFSPARDFSELENRPLNRSPVFTVRSLTDNSYTRKYEEYINDQFAARDNWITLKSLSESALGKLENNGIAYGRSHYLFELTRTFDSRQLEKNLGFIREFGQLYPDESITVTIIPNSHAILTGQLPDGMPGVDQLGLIDESYRALQDGLRICDVVPALSAGKDRYIYYRTDHHWTTLGAYLAYEAYMDSLGLTPAALESYGPEISVPGFYGTYYSKAKNWNALPDVINWYDVATGPVTIDGEAADGIYDRQVFGERDKYAAFLRGNNGLTTIESADEKHEELPKLLLFKDSYGNSFVPFLLSGFGEVHVVDLRYFNDVAGLMAENSYDQIYILYNFSTLSQDLHLYKLALTE